MPTIADRPTQPPAEPRAAEFDATEAWTAVLARDARQDGRFVYAVRTTGVFCRPSCPSRRPRPEHVAFFTDSAAATAAGYRACRRCAPHAPQSDMAQPAAAAAVARARAYLDAHPDAPASLDALARHVGLSPSHLQRTFTRLVGTSPKRYAAALRADRLKAELQHGATVSRATFEAGYGAPSRAYAAAAAHLGMTPAAYRRGGRGVHVRYATAATAVGRVLVAATARGVCAVTLGDDDAALEAALAAEYPEAVCERVDVARLDAGDDLRAWLAAVVRAAGGPGDDPPNASAALAAFGEPADVPTDVHGTAFQRRVWRAVRAIPAGETRSYTAVAAAVGAPRAVRAVASAVASNRVALVVPCHRVVPAGTSAGGASDQDPGRYRWGAERKRQLLAREQQCSPRA